MLQHSGRAIYAFIMDIFTFCVSDRKYQICWNMLVLYDVQQGGETSVLSSSLPSPVSPDRGQQREQSRFQWVLLGIESLKSSIFPRYLILLLHSCIHLSHQGLNPGLLWVGADGPLFGLVPLPLHHKPVHKVPRGNTVQKGAAGNWNLELYRHRFVKTQTLVEDNKAKVSSLTQPLWCCNRRLFPASSNAQYFSPLSASWKTHSPGSSCHMSLRQTDRQTDKRDSLIIN